LISRLLVANRGEIARRVFRSCRRAGIGTVAVFAGPDADAPHVAEADLAVPLAPASGTASPARAYLNGPAIVAAARDAGADAVHPGYGFLAEDPGFARLVLEAGLTWVGPSPEAMAATGLKLTAKKLAAGAGVPVLPELAPEALTEFPVLVKASAGGGGRGMRAVGDPAGLAAALRAARREAEAAFGDGTVFCEPLLPAARHVEVQVVADTSGTIWALTERDCSVQRRYQKVVEESPSPAVDQALRQRLLDAARAVSRAVGYTGAGTAEFLLDGDGRFFFLEFNARLQVEHPVTECVHGIDLVRLQLEVAEGRPLPAGQPPAAGHAIEARLYAEDPADGYRPAAGPLHALLVSGVDTRFGPAAAGLAGQEPYLRLDSGVEPGSTVSPHYDAMLAKLIAWAPDRDTAARRLAAALAGARIHGPATNRDLLVSVLRGTVFRSGRADTSLLDGVDLAGLGPGRAACELSALAAAVADAALTQRAARTASAAAGGWRNVGSQPQRKAYDSPCGRVEAAYLWTRTGMAAAADPDLAAAGTDGTDGADGTAGADGAAAAPAIVSYRPGQVTLDSGGVRHRFDVATYDGAVWVDSALGSVRLTPLPRLPEPGPAGQPGSLVAPMPGNVVRVEAAEGAAVAAGQPILVLEAMKMEHLITAPAAGLLSELRVARGEQVAAGDVLAIVTTVPPGEPPAVPPGKPPAVPPGEPPAVPPGEPPAQTAEEP
jgi:propionyl-CoA carboxylase alpha chain